MGIRKYFGPSTLVTAAFIGPGTLTVCTMAGVNTGYELLWALLFSILATITLQEMAARLGLITQKGLGEAIRNEFNKPISRILSTIIIFSAIVVGNAAYEAGNIGGAKLGMDTIFPFAINIYPLLIGGVAFVLLFLGNYKIIERLLITLVIIMSLVFFATAVFVQPNLSEILKGLFIPKTVDPFLILGIIGTTVVPYNLFLQASSVQEKWKSPKDLTDLRIENAIAIILGGFISICIIITSAAASDVAEIENVSQMAIQLEPLLGSWSKYFFAIGLLAAGMSSAITAPLAAAYATKGIFGWEIDYKHWKFRMIWMIILGIGILFSSLGFKPVAIIQFAQVANAFCLPIVAIFLVYIVNKNSVLGTYKNGILQNILAAFVIIVTLALSFKSLNSLFGFI